MQALLTNYLPNEPFVDYIKITLIELKCVLEYINCKYIFSHSQNNEARSERVHCNISQISIFIV